MSRLVVISEGLTDLSHDLGTRWVTIGRGDKNAFQIVETSVSSQHCEVQLRGTELLVRDLRSTNGTFIEGRSISEAVLKPGEVLRLGQVELMLELVPGTPPVRPAPPAVLRPAPVPAVAPAPELKPEGKGASRKIYRVLFVDDSLAFLQMVTDMFESRPEKAWEIYTASSPDLALSVLQQKLIDLVVLDIGMPLLDGVQLLSFVHQRYPNIKKVVLTGETDDRHRAECLARGAELYLLKPGDEDGWRLIFNMVTSLLQWEDRDQFASSLNDASLYNIIQLECIAGNSSVLEVRNPQNAGEIFIESGRIVHASAGKLAGEKAFYQLLALADGEFRLIPFREPPTRSIDSSWEALLAQATRAQQEEKYSSDDDETILITRKRPATKAPAPAAPAPPPVAPVAPPAPPALVAAPLAGAERKGVTASPPSAPLRAPRGRTTSGMDFVSFEEMVKADTTLISKAEVGEASSGSPPKSG